jgi:hypothetical protein
MALSPCHYNFVDKIVATVICQVEIAKGLVEVGRVPWYYITYNETGEFHEVVLVDI